MSFGSRCASSPELCVAMLCGLMASAPALAQRQFELPTGPLQPAAEARPVPRADGERIALLVRLEGDPAWLSFHTAGGRRGGAAAMQQAERVRGALTQRQDEFLEAASRLGARPGRQFQFLGNVVAVEVESARVRDLALLPGVRAVGPNRRYERADTASTPLTRASEIWAGRAQEGSRFTGQGVTIGIIDEGIDYTHRHFGGQGNYQDNDRTVLGDVDWPPAGPPLLMGDQLVIGGIDLVGDAYDAGLPPQPDLDPAGCPFSHGTHVAGTAAGYGVLSDGSTYTGDLGLARPLLFPAYPQASVANWRIGPGVAPRANLVSLRVFGCSGSTRTDVLLAALEQVATQTFLGEDIDVVNMSLGSPYGGSGPDDFLNGAQQALVELGVVVVASAGNNGNVQLVSGAPGSAAGTISVANVTDSATVVDGSLLYTDPSDGTTQVSIAAAKGAMYPSAAADPLTAPLAIANPRFACGALSEPAPSEWDGKWLLVDGGSCVFSIKAANVKATGAAGMILINGNDLPPFVMGRTTGFDDALPSIMVRFSDGLTLNQRVGMFSFQGTFDGARQVAFAETLALASASTSRGGVLSGDDRILKPNIAAPGTSITSAGAGSNDRGYTISGTSMAAPHIAGIAALLIEAHGRPTDAAGVALIKQRLMSTANRDIGLVAASTQPFHSPQRIGSGLVEAVAALDTRLVAFASDAPENGALSFGYPRQLIGMPALQQVKTITLRNLTNSALQVNTSYQARSIWAGATVAVSPAVIPVPALGQAEVEVTLTVDAAQPDLNQSGDPTYDATARTFLHEVSGFARFGIDGSGQTIRVPVYAAPHLTADTQVQDVLVVADAVATTPMPIGGSGFDLGPDPDDHVSLVSAYQHLASSDVETALFWDADQSGDNAPDEQLTDYLYADIAHLGASTHVIDAATTRMYLGLAMHGEWNSPRDLFVQAYVDIDDDGTDDYIWYYGSSASDVFLSFVERLSSGEAFSFGERVSYADGSSLNTMLLRNNVLSMPILLRHPDFSALGWPNYDDGPIRLTVVTYQRDSDFSLPIDVVQAAYTPTMTISTPDGSANLAVGANGNRFDITHDFTGISSLPLLLTLHHHQHDAASRTQLTALFLPAQPFNLLTPSDDSSFADASVIGGFTWQAVADATAYSVDIGTLTFGGTPADDGDSVVCEAGTCRLLATPFSLGAGTFSWNAQASHPGGDVGAANGPFDFTLAGAAPDTIFEDGFEE